MLVSGISLTVVVYNVFNITENLRIPSLSSICLLIHGLAILLEHSGGLRIEYKWDSEQALWYSLAGFSHGIASISTLIHSICRSNQPIILSCQVKNLQVDLYGESDQISTIQWFTRSDKRLTFKASR